VAVDVWSLGVIVWVMIAGRIPFITNNVLHLVEMIVKEDATFPDFFSPPLRNSLSLMVTKEPRQALDNHRRLRALLDRPLHKTLLVVARDDWEHRDSVIAAEFDLPEAECEQKLREPQRDRRS
jgi:serine/threonine protein kinase